MDAHRLVVLAGGLGWLLLGCRGGPVVGSEGGAVAPTATDGSAASAVPARPAVPILDGTLSPGLLARGFVGDGSCGECHADLVRDHATTAHAAAAAAGQDAGRLLGGAGWPVVVDHTGVSGFRYELSLQEGLLQVRESYRMPDETLWPTRQEEAALVVGSGRLTFTTLGATAVPRPGQRPAVRLFQLPVTRYRAAARWAMSPGYDLAGQQRFGREIHERCIFCHNGMQEPLPGQPTLFEPQLPIGIGCERCHGPAREHVRIRRQGTAEAEPLVRLGQLPRDRRQDVCLSCHLEGHARILRRDRASIYEFQPGEALGDLLYVFTEEPPEPRLFTHSSHGERFVLSRCYTASGGELTCEDCHPAHRPSPKDPGSFTRVCLRCHTPETCTRPSRGPADRRGPKDPCTDCHMAWGGTSDIPYVTTMDHWIRKPLPELAVPPELAQDPTRRILRIKPADQVELRLMTRAGRHKASEGEQLAAVAQAYLEFERSNPAPPLLARARSFVQLARAAEPDRADHWRLTARLESRGGHRREACFAWQEAATRDPGDPATWEALALCRGDEGNTGGARQAFEELLRRDPRSVTAHNGLGYLELTAGRPAAAASWYDRSLALDDRVAATWHNLAALRLLQQDLAGAEAAWRQAFALDPRVAPVAEGLREVVVRRSGAREALIWARQAARLLPRDRLAQQRLAEVAEQAGERELARQAYTAALALEPDHPVLRQALNRLAGAASPTPTEGAPGAAANGTAAAGTGQGP